MRNRTTALILVLILCFYLLLAVQRGVWLVATGKPVLVLFGIGVLMLPVVGAWFVVTEDKPVLVLFGIGVLMLPVVGAWFVVTEVRMGNASSRLGTRLEAEGLWPTEEIPRRPSGRPDLKAADEIFEKRKAEVEADPENWRGWYRLSLAYNDARDRSRARKALRKAIELDRQQA